MRVPLTTVTFSTSKALNKPSTMRTGAQSGSCASEPFFVAAGTQNFNTNTDTITFICRVMAADSFLSNSAAVFGQPVVPPQLISKHSAPPVGDTVDDDAVDITPDPTAHRDLHTDDAAAADASLTGPSDAQDEFPYAKDV